MTDRATAYLAPRVEGAIGDTVQPDQDDVTVVVPAQPGIVKDDKVILFLDNGSAPPREEEFTAHADTDIRLYLRPEYLSGNDGRDIATRYVVTGKGESAVYTFHVGSSLELPAPEVPEAVNGELPGDVAKATFRVPATAHLPAGTKITAYFAATEIGKGTVEDGAVDISIPAAAIVAARGSTVVLFYTTLGPGELRRSADLAIAVGETIELTEDFERFPEMFAFGQLAPLPAERFTIVPSQGSDSPYASGVVTSADPSPPYTQGKHARSASYGGFSIALWEPAQFLEFGLLGSGKTTIDALYEGNFVPRHVVVDLPAMVSFSTAEGHPPVSIVNIHGSGAQFLRVDNIKIRV